jgi:hypothetical protein
MRTILAQWSWPVSYSQCCLYTLRMRTSNRAWYFHRFQLPILGFSLWVAWMSFETKLESKITLLRAYCFIRFKSTIRAALHVSNLSEKSRLLSHLSEVWKIHVTSMDENKSWRFSDLHITGFQNNGINFCHFISSRWKMRPEYLRLLCEKDPRALLLLSV